MKTKAKKNKNKPQERFDVITIFPKIFDSYLKESLIRKASEKKIIEVKVHNLRDWSVDKHRKVDDRPFGGGPGMVLKVEPIYKAVISILKSFNKKFSLKKHPGSRIILFSTRGKKLNSQIAQRFSEYNQLILICGRYEGVDERVAKYIADEEISIGDYILSGGELPAMVLIESVSRFLPGFLGKKESLEEVKGSYPTYTRPEIFWPDNSKNSWRVPKILLSGDHRKIEEWRKKHG